MTEFIAEKKAVVSRIKAVVTVYIQEKRPEIIYLLKNIDTLSLKKGEKDNLKRYLADLGLYDLRNDRRSDMGQKALLNDMVTIPQTGLYGLSYVVDPVPGIYSQIVDYNPEQPVRELSKQATEPMENYRDFDDAEFTSWNNENGSFRVVFERPEGSKPRVITDREVPAEVKISGNSDGKCQLVINCSKLKLRHNDVNYFSFSLKDNIKNLIPGYDPEIDAIRVGFNEIKDDREAFEKFRKSSYNFDDKTLIFNRDNDDDRWNVKIKNIDLVPETKSDAEKWVFNLALGELMSDIDKFYFTMEHCDVICNKKYAETPISRVFNGTTANMVNFRNFLENENPRILAEIKIAEDLCPVVNTVNPINNIQFPIINQKNNNDDLFSIIEMGENEKTEFKETFFGIKRPQEKQTSIFRAIKTIAAFMNSNGGKLLIGISDDGSIKGIEGDYCTINQIQQKGNRDAFKLMFDQEFGKYFGNGRSSAVKLDIMTVEGKDVCIISVDKQNYPVHIKSTETDSEMFFIRKTASTVQL
ncbi:MAG: ATP-binding protein, partial [Candidatus Cloacimonetes bacterium]|nr:ATP-binding protein [Candidatus Cloacimonadota bacterium]